MANTPTQPPGKPEQKRKGGRPVGTGFHPTAEQRQMVEGLTGYGIPQDEIVKLIINPSTGNPISERTLHEHFRTELDQGKAKANAKVVAGLFKNCTTATPLYPGGHPASQIFWCKTRLGWRTTDFGEDAPAPVTDERNDLEAARRIAYALHRGLKAKELKQLA